MDTNKQMQEQGTAAAVPLPGLKAALARAAKGKQAAELPKRAKKVDVRAGAKAIAKAVAKGVVKHAPKAETEQERQARLAKLRVNNCLCGCGTKVKGRFAQGHDQRVRGMIARNELNNTLRQAIGRHVVVPEIERPNQPVLLGVGA
jgi:hypothetical protein